MPVRLYRIPRLVWVGNAVSKRSIGMTMAAACIVYVHYNTILYRTISANSQRGDLIVVSRVLIARGRVKKNEPMTVCKSLLCHFI